MLRAILADAVDLLEVPVDGFWARDTLADFAVFTNSRQARVDGDTRDVQRLGRQTNSRGDTQLAAIVAGQLGVQLLEFGRVGEGSAIEIDGQGTVLATESSWVNANRNPGKSRAEIEASILRMLGANRMIWVDGLAGADITDGQSYKIVEVVQPSKFRNKGADFLATYMNYYVSSGAVIAPQFDDTAADDAAKAVLSRLFPDREIVVLNIDALAAGGGGGIHCATQQQPLLG